jgi:hypothetical protein
MDKLPDGLVQNTCIILGGRDLWCGVPGRWVVVVPAPGRVVVAGFGVLVRTGLTG